jgi:transposase
MGQFETPFSQLDVLPLVEHYTDEHDLINLFAKYVPGASNSLADHAESLCILTANIICDNKPLYKIQEWLAKYSFDLATEPVAAKPFNDDRLAKSLSVLFEADRHWLMTEVSGNTIAVHNLITDEIHNDSTTVTFIGKYDSPDPQAVKLKLGHNKDFRPDCKQVLFGLNFTSDGHVPLSHKLFDGNTTDDVTHIASWNALRTLLDKENFIYVANCKLCSQKNLDHISQDGGLFITIVPKDRKEVKRFYQHLKKTILNGNMPLMWKVHARKASLTYTKPTRRNRRRKVIASSFCVAAPNKKTMQKKDKRKSTKPQSQIGTCFLRANIWQNHNR